MQLDRMWKLCLVIVTLAAACSGGDSAQRPNHADTAGAAAFALIAAPSAAEVLDARDGATLLSGQISARSDCSGKTNCIEQEISVPLEAGSFSLPNTFELTERTAVLISVPGFQARLVALGPQAASREPQIIYMCPEGASNLDRDSLCDHAEALYGTDPEKVDSDGDFFNDDEEVFGRPLDSGYAFDLRGFGADPRHIDVFLQIDYMPGFAPAQEAVDMVVKAFDDAPNSNPDGLPGIKLHASLVNSLPAPPGPALFDLDPEFSVFDSWKNDPRFFKPGRKNIFHYAVFGRNQIGFPSSGRSRGFGSWDFYVTLGTFEFASSSERVTATAGTLMHELGHNLGLQHGGHDCKNYKPHYVSVMNYLYQLTGVPRDGGYSLDYSRFAVAGFDENTLDERGGFAPGPNATTPDLARYRDLYVCASGTANTVDCNYQDESCDLKEGWTYSDPWEKIQGSLSGPLDFNRDGMPGLGDPPFDVNGNQQVDQYEGVRDDWGSLQLGGYPDRDNQRFVSQQPNCPPLPSF